MKRRRQVRMVLLFVIALITGALIASPYQNSVTKLLLLLGIFAVWGGALHQFWNSILARIFLLLPALGVFALLFLSYKQPDPTVLRQLYVDSLRHYDGVRFFANGESSLGIDSAGLVRRGMIDATLTEGWRTKDLTLLRMGASLWWYDASFKDFQTGYNGRMRSLFTAASLNSVDGAQLHAGDVALADEGQRILVYLGDKTWIGTSAEGAGAVTILKAPVSDPKLANTPIQLVRWYRLQ